VPYKEDEKIQESTQSQSILKNVFARAWRLKPAMYSLSDGQLVQGFNGCAKPEKQTMLNHISRYINTQKMMPNG